MAVFQYKNMFIFILTGTCLLKLKLKFQTGSGKHITSHMMYLESSVREEFVTCPKLFSPHITVSLLNSNLVNVITTSEFINTMSVEDVYPSTNVVTLPTMSKVFRSLFRCNVQVANSNAVNTCTSDWCKKACPTF